MKAILVIREAGSEWAFLGPDRTPTLLPLLDRPVLQHGIESLVSTGAKEITIATLTAVEAVRHLVGDGLRWGVKIVVHPMRDLRDLPALAREFAGDAPYLVVDAERVPDHPAEPSTMGAQEQLDRDTHPCLDVHTPGAYLASWNRMCGETLPNLVQTGRRSEDNIVIGRNTQVHPTAKIIGPAYIGERCLVGAGAEVGPNAFVGADSIVEDGATLTGCIVLPHTYVGTRLEVRRKIVYCSTIYDLDRRTSLTAVEDFLLGSTRSAATKPSVAERASALGLAVLLSPAALLGLAFRGGSGASLGHPSLGKDLCARVAPGLWSVAMGKRHLVGAPKLEANQRREVEQLAPGLLASAPEGLLTDAYVKFGPAPTVDQLWASIAFTAADRDGKSKRSLVREYFAGAFGLRRPEWSES